MKFRVVKRPNIWGFKPAYYPEFRYKWWPFWFRFDNGLGYQLFYKHERHAINFIEKYKLGKSEDEI